MQTPHRFIQALRRQPVDQTPIWIMRQAGRYLPEYRELRAKAKGFLQLCQTPELACEITLQPIKRFPLDAAIIFSDILTIPHAMGLGLHFVEHEGPRFHHPIRTIADIDNLPIPDVNTELRYVTDAISLTRRELANKIPLIGFSGSPWTLATYMLEGGSSKTFSVCKKWLFQEPEALHALLKKLAIAVSQYLEAQIEAGAEVVMLFDTWGGILTPQAYATFSLRYMQYVIEHLRAKYHTTIPIIMFTKNGGQWLEQMAESGPDALGLDWTMNIGEARQRVGNKVALQGNMDPAVLYAAPEKIETEVSRILEDFGNHPGHIFNLGHGVQPDTPYEHVAALVAAVHRLSNRA